VTGSVIKNKYKERGNKHKQRKGATVLFTKRKLDGEIHREKNVGDFERNVHEKKKKVVVKKGGAGVCFAKTNTRRVKKSGGGNRVINNN